MGTMDDDIAWLQTQLTMARWHLDAALAAPIELARRNIERARQAYDGAREALENLDVTAERRELIARELVSIRERLQAAGAEI
jgi:hypothetical protein